MSFADITPVSDRTSQVRDAIITAAGVNTAADVTNTHLAAITSLNIRSDGITELKSGDFSGMTGLTSLNLYGNELSSLPDGIFEGLTALTTLRLGGNTVNPMPITVSLEKVADGQFKAVAPTGAPFDIVLPISATNGSIADNTTSITIAKGSTESSTLTITRTADTTAAVTTNIGTLPSLPTNHYGYSLSKSSDLPVEIIAAVTTEEETTPTPPVEDENVAPEFTAGANTTRSIAENTAAATNIGTAISATDANSDTLTYNLGGTDAASFDIDSSSGQLKTKTTLDYETKKIYTITISVSDGSLTDTIIVVISIVDVSETTIVPISLPVNQRTTQVRDAIVAAVPNVTDAADVTDTHLAAITTLNLRDSGITSLQTGDFAGLTSLTSLNLYGNMLSSLPYGIFEGLTSLTALRLGGNLVEPMPLIVSIQQVSTGQFKAVIAEGAPFDISVPVNGSTVTVSQGSTASTTFTSTINVSMGTLPSLPANHYGYVLAKSAVCNRTLQVAEAIAAAVPNVTDCNNVTEVDLATITTLDLSSKSITSLQSDDFAGLLSLSTVDLSNNQLSSLPAGIFEGLTNLSSVDLSGNTTDPISLSILLEKVGTNQIKAVISTGAPFSITLPITVANGSLSGDATLTIPTGSVESTPQTITRTPNTIGAVTANIGTLSIIPSSHSGYALGKSSNLPLAIFSEINVAPVFTDGTTITRTIAENTVADTNIGSPVSATDSNNDTLTYRLSGTDAASFDIISTTGQLTTKAALDYETKSSYSVTITVSDGSLTDTINVTIDITDIDENRAPVFTDGETTTRSIAENTAADTNIGTPISATDADDDTLTYTLTGTDADTFDIISSSGQLQTKSDLDYETKSSYSVTITVSDGNLTDSISVTINVTDVDENRAPVFPDGESATRSVAENTGSGVNIGTAVSATDADDDTLTYTLTGTDAAAFSIDSTSGQLRTKSALDYETKKSYSVSITVSDSRLTDSISVTINVTDVDETPATTTKDTSTPNKAPIFTDGNSTTRTVAENTGSGVDIGPTVSATDTDKDDTLIYSLDGTDASSFSLDSTSGQLRTYSTLDYETKNSYSVTITVSDGNLTDSISVTINITDVDENRAPVFTDGESTTRSIAENTGSGVNISTPISATDADNDTLTYTLIGTDADTFDIISSSGQLQTKSDLDYETKSSYSVTITVSDGNLTDTISVTINVTDVDETPATTTKDTSTPNNAPVFSDGNSITRSVAENTAANTNIGTAVSATDADDDTLTYRLSGTDASVFSIDSSSGQLKTNAALDYETKDSYSVTIKVSDGNGGSDSISVTINITDVDESAPNNAPTFDDGDTATRTVAENTSSGVDIGSAVSATDTDDDTLTYSLSGTDASSFSIDSSSGQLRTSASLDYETKESYSVTVEVSDGRDGSDSISVTINVTDLDETVPNNAPMFATDSTTRSIAENTAADTNIGGTITATDADSDTLTYILRGTNAGDFSIVNSSGQLITKSALNHESKSSYSVIITASDGKGGSDSISVTISVTDVNEAPIFADGTTATRAIAENVGADINIGKAVSASDPDDGAKLEYTLDGTNADSFNIESTTGQLKTKAALDFETKPSYSVIVKVSDGTLTDSIAVTINVTDLDETPSNIAPMFDDGESTSRSIAENTPAGRNIGAAVSATDTDSNTLAYLLSGDDASSFSIDDSTGQLKTSAALNYEDEDEYTVKVTVSDGSSTDDIDVTISVTDVNEAPVFADDSTILSVAENTATNTNIGSAITATDPDGDDLTYSLEGTDASSFDIVSTTGQLKTKAALDYEDETSYSVTLKASDDNLTDTISITINVTDVDENRAPTFASESTTLAVAENTGPGVNIGDAVSATDADEDTLTYTLSGTDEASFDINSTNGQLRTKAALDYEDKRSYSVTVTASDSKKSDIISVTINVTDVNENRAPSFGSASTTRTVAENSASGTNIGDAVSATDADEDTITYTLGGTDEASFDIVSTSGHLQTSAALDYETKRSYSVTVTATDDSGASNNSAMITVTITVTDVNENRAPTFANESTTRSVAENTASGANIGDAVSATDADEDTLTYTLGGTDEASFSIVSTSGQLQTSAALDYEDKRSYSVTVTATDDSGASNNSATIAVTISITDVDENRAPSFAGSSISFSISDIASASVGDSIGLPITATDLDEDTLEYSLGGDDASKFTIDSSSAQLKVTQSLIDDTSSSYSIKVIATDPDNATAEISVTITVTRLETQQQQQSNSTPTFDNGTSTTRSIAENTASGQNIGDPMSASDDDTGDTLTYTLEGTDAASFSIVSTSGQLQTSAALDYETKSSYSVSVKVTDDSGASNNSATITVTINVTQVCDKWSYVEDAITKAVGVNSYSNVTQEHLNSITSLDLTDLQLVWLPSVWSDQFCDMPSLTQIDLSHNDLGRVSDNAFSGLSSLTHLDLGNTAQSIYSTNTRLILTEDVFAGLSSLTHLHLDFCIMWSLPAGIFDGLSSLTRLDLNHNKISNDGLPTDVFDGLSSLTELSLGSNQITILPSDIFDGLSSLTYLNVSHNDIDNDGLPTDVFDGLSSLKELHLYGNKLTSVPSGIFDGLSSLTELTLFNNNLTSLPSDVFDGLSSLEALRMSGFNHISGYNKPTNSLTSLPSGIFDGLSSLTELTLGGNKLSSLSSDVFDGLSSLTELTLGGNRLTTLPSNIFGDLSSLTFLGLSGNKLSSLSSDVFAGLSSLTYLGLAENSLTSLPSGVFAGLSSLEELTLKDNSLTSLPSGIFDGLSSLTSLNLLDNNLTGLPSLTGLSSLTDLGLANNSFTGLPSLTGLSSLSRLNISNNNISSLSSDVFAGLSSLTLINLSDNNLTSLPDGLFSGLTSLVYLSLQDNNTDPMNITVTLVKEGDSSIKVSIPIGAPFDVIVPVTITNGSLDGGATTITISIGSVESDAVAITRTAGTTEAVTADIGTLPSLPTRHSGYTLVKASTGLPLTVLDVGGAPSKEKVIPSATALLTNYPNPFNPETWIPYHLADPSDVQISIYNMQGVIVRRLELGHQPAGYYTSRKRAAYWDGTNAVGERVGSGLYFYQLQVGKMSYMRKMVILK